MAETVLAAELVALLPWDDPERGLPAGFTDEVGFSWSSGPPRRVRAPAPVRVDASGGLHVLGRLPAAAVAEPGSQRTGGAVAVHLDADGRVAGRTELQGLEGRQVDFTSDPSQQSVVLVEIVDQGRKTRRVTAFRPDGDTVWSAGGSGAESDDPVSSARRIRFCGRQVLCVAEGVVARLDAATGKALGVARLRGGSGMPFVGGDRVLATYYDDAASLRGIVELDPETGAQQNLPGSDEEFGWLVHPFGADAERRLYVWRQGAIARVAPGGGVQVLGGLDAVAVRGSEVFTSWHDGDRLLVRHAGGTGAHVDTERAAPPGSRLIGVDPQGRYVVLRRAPGSAAEVTVVGPDGTVHSSGAAQPDLIDLECRTPVFDEWQVDADGRLVIPVATPEGLAIVRTVEH